ncbi:protein TonB [Mucilaginibacter mallensis]|uniref:Protein TonB n=2 Tax=Mucilaginibacter mallensis TaxID=652787 RepID=A0A1H1S2R6_MUCMA|nr:protein TonB [Mucilaginibacter mallensis]
MLLSFVITAKAQQNNKPTDSAARQSQNTNQETVPEPPGGIGVFMKYMIKYTNHQYNSSETGKVTLSFVVEKDGSLTEPKIVHSLNTEADGIAIQVLKDHNQKWKPAMQNGQPVRALYTISVPFGKN